MRSRTVVVGDHHVKLLQRMYVHWDSDAYEGAPTIDIKRPYGNSDVLGDVAEILGWPLVTDRYGEEMMTEKQAERAKVIHEQMADVLQILVRNPLTFSTGVWVNQSSYGVDYVKEA